MNILFTCAGRRVELLGAFRRAMKELDITGQILATDITCHAGAMQIADKAVVVPPVRHLKYMSAIEDIVRENNIGLIVPLTDLDLRSLARRRDRFQANGCTVMIGPEDVIKLCRDKQKFAQHLADAGMPAIRTHTLNQFRKKSFYPCFVKPTGGSSGIGSAKISNEVELKAHIKTFGDQLIVQDFIPGQEYTIDVYRTREGKIKSIVPRQRLMVRSGEVDQGITVKDEQLFETAGRAIGLMDGLWGVFCLQCRRPIGGAPYYFELNPRFGGGAPLSIAAGANLPMYLLQEVLSLPVTAKVGDFSEKLMMIRYTSDIFVKVENPRELVGYNSPLFR